MEDPLEAKADVVFDCVVNGAELAMPTTNVIKLNGGESVNKASPMGALFKPAYLCFLRVGRRHQLGQGPQHGGHGADRRDGELRVPLDVHVEGPARGEGGGGVQLRGDQRLRGLHGERRRAGDAQAGAQIYGDCIVVCCVIVVQ